MLKPMEREVLAQKLTEERDRLLKLARSQIVGRGAVDSDHMSDSLDDD